MIKKTINKYTEEQKAFILNNYKGMSSKKLAELFNEKFLTSLTDKQIKYYKCNHKLNSGLTGRFEKGHIPANKGTKGICKSNITSFKKGHIPHNHRPVGSERISKDGYIEIKIAEPNKWKLKQRVIYEQAFGPIPKDCVVAFADSNKLNLSLDNLILVSKSENLIMNKRRMYYSNAECTKSSLLVAKIILKSRARLKQ